MNDNASSLIMLVLVLALYFLPSIVAALRNHHNGAAISVLNLLLGWTLIGWIAALVWASTDTRQGATGSATEPRPAADGEEMIKGLRVRATMLRGTTTSPDRGGVEIPPTDVTFDYIDARGEPTQRTVTIRNIEIDMATGAPFMVMGRCHARKADRNFRIARMDCVISEDGEVLDPDEFFEELVDSSAGFDSTEPRKPRR